jgi:hypothetical protein
LDKKIEDRKDRRLTDGQTLMTVEEASKLGDGLGRKGCTEWTKVYRVMHVDYSLAIGTPADKILYLYSVEVIYAQRKSPSRVAYTTFLGECFTTLIFHTSLHVCAY